MWKEDLERFPLSRLSLYSIEIRSSGRTATILDPDGYLHTIKQIDHIGQVQGGYSSIECVTRKRLIISVVEPDLDPASPSHGGYLEHFLQWEPQKRPVPIDQAHLPKGCEPGRDKSK